MEHFQAFKSAIRWTEPFVLSIIGFQVIMFLLCIWVSRPNRTTTTRITFMICIGLIVRSAEYLNKVGAREWESFATQDYFDKQGIFVLTFLSGPLLIDCILLLIMFVREASQLLVQVKRKEFEKKKKNAGGKRQKKDTDRTTTSSSSNPKKRKPKKED